MCFYVDPETNIGTCMPFCAGAAHRPVCEDPERICVQSSGGSLNLCFETCNPLVQGCPEGRACYPHQESFICGLDASHGAGTLNEPCQFVNACAPGFHCRSDEACPRGASGCCRPYCEVGQLGPRCSPLEECEPWFDEPVPAGLEDVGYCVPVDL